MVFQKLREACLQDHLNIKQGEYARLVMEQALTLENYRVLLLTNYFFHGTIEQQLNRVVSPGFKKSLQLQRRRKAQFITSDYQRLGHTLPPLSKAPLQLCIQNETEALGVLYVTEGTAIGGSIIKKNLLKSPVISQTSATSFYGCYGKELSPLWKAFVAQLNTIEGRQEAEAVVIEKAKATFAFYEGLIRKLEQQVQESQQLAVDFL